LCWRSKTTLESTDEFGVPIEQDRHGTDKGVDTDPAKESKRIELKFSRC
jgi:hypothetical protein